jgi:hypothetical protein
MGAESLNDYPGKTAPRNRGKKKPARIEDPFAVLHTVTFTIRGEEVSFYTVGEVAKALNRKSGTIRKWETLGYIPTATFRTPPPEGQQIPGKVTKGRRLYSRSQVELLIYSVQHFGLDNSQPNKANWLGFKKHIKENWIK